MDWYISPADRFSYENSFSKYSKDEESLTLPDLDPLFHISRIETNEFLQIWQLIDIKFEQRINKTQFIYLQHIVNQRRRGKPIPYSLPLNIKEEFLKEIEEERLYIRRSTNHRDIGAGSNQWKDLKTLQEEYENVEINCGSAERSLALAKFNADEQQVSKEEVEGLLNYIKKYESYLKSYIDSQKTSNSAASFDLNMLRNHAKVCEDDFHKLEQKISALNSEIDQLKIGII